MARTKSRGRPRANGAPLQWTDDMTLALFQYRADSFALAPGPHQQQRTGSRWRAVATRLGDAFGVEFDVTQCRNKARSLIKSAKKRYAQYVQDHPVGAAADTPEPRLVSIVRQFCGDGDHDEDEDHADDDGDDDADGVDNEEPDGDEAEESDTPAVAAGFAFSPSVPVARDSAALLAPSMEQQPLPPAAEVVTSAASAASLFVSPAGSAKKRGRPSRSGEGALQWTDPLTEKLIHARFDGAPRGAESYGGKGSQRVVWGAIATRMSEETGMRIEPAQCKNKMKVLTARWTQYLKSLQGSSEDREPEPQWATVMRLYCGVGASGAPAPARSENREEQAVPPSAEAVAEKEDDGAALAPARDDDGGAGEEDAPSSASKRRRVAKSKTIRWSDAMTEKLFRLRFETLRGEFASNRNALHLHHAWEVLAQDLSLDFGSSAEFTAEQCKSKIKATKIRWDQYKEALSSGIISPPAVDPEWVRIIKHYCGGVIDVDDESEMSGGVERIAPAAWPSRPLVSEPPLEPPPVNVATVASISRRTTVPTSSAAAPSAAATTGARCDVGSQSACSPAHALSCSDPPPSTGATQPEAAASNGHAKSAELAIILESSSADTPVLAQILNAIHEQREAALQQTRVIQELLDFLREERNGRVRQV